MSCHCNHFPGIYHNTVYQVKVLSMDSTKNYSQREFIRILSRIHGIPERLENLAWKWTDHEAALESGKHEPQ